MAESFNININNGMASGKSSAMRKLSAKGSIQKNKNTMQIAKRLKTSMRSAGNAVSSISSGSSTGVLTSKLSKSGGIIAVLGAGLVAVEKVSKFGVNVYEVNTGNTLTSHNVRTMINTVSSLGTNYAYGMVRNEIFTKKLIQRQNYGLDYYRELYDINTEGSKFKKT